MYKKHKLYLPIIVFLYSFQIVFSQNTLDNLIIKKTLSQDWELDSIDKKEHSNLFLTNLSTLPQEDGQINQM